MRASFKPTDKEEHWILTLIQVTFNSRDGVLANEKTSLHLPIRSNQRVPELQMYKIYSLDDDGINSSKQTTRSFISAREERRKSQLEHHP